MKIFDENDLLTLWVCDCLFRLVYLDYATF